MTIDIDVSLTEHILENLYDVLLVFEKLSFKKTVHNLYNFNWFNL